MTVMKRWDYSAGTIELFCPETGRRMVLWQGDYDTWPEFVDAIRRNIGRLSREHKTEV